MSKNRIGVLTNMDEFRLDKYGLHSYSCKKSDLTFAFLCMLTTPESKQELKNPYVTVSACVDARELEIIMNLTASHQAYFHDL